MMRPVAAFSVLLVAASILAASAAAPAQTRQNQLSCRGVFEGHDATLSGTRRSQITARGSEAVRFEGRIAAAGRQGVIAWEGWHPPYEGFVQAPGYSARIGVLDNTGGRLVIYGGRASLGPPTELGQFVCQWR